MFSQKARRVVLKYYSKATVIFQSRIYYFAIFLTHLKKNEGKIMRLNFSDARTDYSELFIFSFYTMKKKS